MRILRLSAWLGVSILLTTVGLGAELTPAQLAAKQALEKSVGGEAHQGSIIAQARLDGFNYRQLLQRCIGRNEDALRDLFQLRFIGEAGESHSADLLHLMVLWGDADFAAILADQPEAVRKRVVGFIDYAWAEPEWGAYARVLALSPESIGSRD